MTDDEKETYSIKAPSFSGNKDDWPFFRVKMESYLVQKDCVDLLNWKQDVPKDGETWQMPVRKTRLKAY